ncbi:MAG: NAD(P)/FAD-dependent oxidoreductase, partial [Rhodopirellula sp.]|nr:NAD(P)/FAD-dependent oxidoreductase [Rhodopirellula sp.]
MIAPAKCCDVLIVGGGPAGSTCAWRLRQHRIDTQILDRAIFPRDKVCAGWITPQVIESLALDLDEYRSGRVLQPIVSFRVSVLNDELNHETRREDVPSESSVQVDYDSPVSYGIRRCEFDGYLLRRSEVPVHQGVTVHAIERVSDGWLVNDQFRCRILVGAGGHFCPVARMVRSQAEIADDDSRVVMAQECEFRLTGAALGGCRVEPGIPELFFYPDLQGYAWCVRKGDWLNIGLGREGERHLSQWRDDFVRQLIVSGRISEPPATPFKGHAYRLRDLASQPAPPEGILLIGDAIGLADSHSGEGIRPAIESGLIAADTIAEIAAAPDGDLLRT